MIRVEPQVFDVLTQLVRNSHRFVTKEELFDSVWGGRFVGEAALTSRIKAARRALGDDGESQRYIRTVRGRGYQFVGTILTDLQSEPAAEALRSRRRPPAHRVLPCRRRRAARLRGGGGGTAACQGGQLDDPPRLRHRKPGVEALGARPVPEVSIHPLRRTWLWPIRLGSNGFTFDDWVTDLESVVEALGLERFPLLGVSQGGAVAVAYAARHPERVSHLVLCGAYARGRAVRAVGDEEKRAAALDLDLARVGWGRDDPAFRQVFAAQFLPDGTRADWAAFDQLQRRTTSPENAVRFLEEFGRIDVRDEAQQVACPTLIMHSRDDHRVPMRFGEELAALIPDSRLVALSSNNHLLTAAEPAWQVFRAEVDAFLA